MTASVTIFGASDDLIEIAGDVSWVVQGIDYAPKGR